MMHGHIKILIALALAAASSAAGAQSPGPKASFDCARARLDVEKEICATPELARLDLDIAAAYAAAARALDAAGRTALAASQKEFVALRNLGRTAQDFVLKDHLQRRAAFLKTIRSAGGQWAGTWGNDYGAITLTRRGDGGYDVKGEANDPAAGRWTCYVDHGGAVTGQTMKTVHRSKEEAEEDPYDGWTLTLRRSGDSLRITASPGQDKTIPNPFCGVHGSFEGVYLPVRAP